VKLISVMPLIQVLEENVWESAPSGTSLYGAHSLPVVQPKVSNH